MILSLHVHSLLTGAVIIMYIIGKHMLHTRVYWTCPSPQMLTLKYWNACGLSKWCCHAQVEAIAPLLCLDAVNTKKCFSFSLLSTVFKSGTVECNIDVTSLLIVRAFVHCHEYVMTFLPASLEKYDSPQIYNWIYNYVTSIILIRNMQ